MQVETGGLNDQVVQPGGVSAFHWPLLRDTLAKVRLPGVSLTWSYTDSTLWEVFLRPQLFSLHLVVAPPESQGNVLYLSICTSVSHWGQAIVYSFSCLLRGHNQTLNKWMVIFSYVPTSRTESFSPVLFLYGMVQMVCLNKGYICSLSTRSSFRVNEVFYTLVLQH